MGSPVDLSAEVIRDCKSQPGTGLLQFGSDSYNTGKHYKTLTCRQTQCMVLVRSVCFPSHNHTVQYRYLGSGCGCHAFFLMAPY